MQRVRAAEAANQQASSECGFRRRKKEKERMNTDRQPSVVCFVPYFFRSDYFFFLSIVCARSRMPLFSCLSFLKEPSPAPSFSGRIIIQQTDGVCFPLLPSLPTHTHKHTNTFNNSSSIPPPPTACLYQLFVGLLGGQHGRGVPRVVLQAVADVVVDVAEVGDGPVINCVIL